MRQPQYLRFFVKKTLRRYDDLATLFICFVSCLVLFLFVAESCLAASSPEAATKPIIKPALPAASDVDALIEKGVREDDKGIVEMSGKSLSQKEVLEDKANRIPEVFKISPALSDRVKFWFEVYTKYGSNINIFHHSEYPWVIYDVLDTKPVLDAHKNKSNKWTKFHKAEALVKKKKSEIKKALLELEKHPDAKKHSALAEKMAKALSVIPGKRKTVYRLAAHSLRTQIGQRDFFEKGLITSSKYLPQMEETFAKYDLPIELTRLPLVESSFNEKAISKVGASGIWQFMPTTGKKKKLKVENNFDERNSPIKATEAAAHLMLENFRIFKSWPLALTSYNHGAGSLLRVLKKTKTNDLGGIIKDYGAQKFGFASSNFFPSYLAALHAEQYQTEVFGDLPKAKPIESDSIRLKFAMKAKRVIDQAGITLEELKLYNPDLRRSVRVTTMLPKGYNLHLPVGRTPRIELFEIDNKSVDTDRKSKRSTPLGMEPKKNKANLSEKDSSSKPMANMDSRKFEEGGSDPYGTEAYQAQISKDRAQEKTSGTLQNKKIIEITFDD